VPTNRVDQILALAVDEVGEALADVPEDQWFERKSIRVAAKDFAVALVALANAEGGIAVVGLHDGTVEGVRHHTGRVNDLRQAPLNHTQPPVRTHFEQVSCRNERGELDTVLVARVAPGEVVHELKNGTATCGSGTSRASSASPNARNCTTTVAAPPMTAKPSPTARSRTWIGPLSRPTGAPPGAAGASPAC